MNHQTVFEKLRKIIVEQLEVDPDIVTLDAHFFNDLNADELDGVELVQAVEEEFDIEIPYEVIEQIATVQQAMDYLLANLPFIQKRLEELQQRIEQVADYWIKLEFCEEEAIDITRQAFKLIKDRNISSQKKELIELKIKLDSMRVEAKLIAVKIEQYEKDLE